MALEVLLYLPIFALTLYTLYSLGSLLANYIAARRIGLPIKIIPISPENPVWLLFGNKIISCFIRPLFGENRFTKYTIRGWVFYQKFRVASELGDCFTFVTPDRIWVFICDPIVLLDVLQRRGDFPRPLEMLSMLTTFGPNVATVEGAEWQRHRKITSVPFNDSNNRIVWNESVSQARQVLHLWRTCPYPIFETAANVRTLTLHVLSAAAFGRSYAFNKATEPPKPGNKYNYRDSLAMILDEIIIILLLGPQILTSRFLPTRLLRVGHAIKDFRSYMEDLYTEEKKAISKGQSSAISIMASLIRASETAGSSGGCKTPLSEGDVQGLSKSEIQGNTFVYNFAGHDTTATTLSWAVYLLAAHPEVQEWITEEIGGHFGSNLALDCDYAMVFPRLKRCRAILYETLRLFNPLPGIIKSTGSTMNEIQYNGTKKCLPAGVRLILNTDAIHTYPKYWGTDSMEWKPQRWITAPMIGNQESSEETLLEPSPGTYAPFSGGARVCPGKKLAQVEFVATIATFFHLHRVEPVPKFGESMERARARVKAVVQDSGMVLLLQMLHPETVGLRWIPRDMD